MGKRNEKDTVPDIPTAEMLEELIKQNKYRQNFRSVFRSTVFTLITVSAIAILVATLWLPVLQIYGTSMQPTLMDGNIVLSVKTSDLKAGDIVAFYYNNNILVKRMIAKAGEWVEVDSDGTVYINDEELKEPYIMELAYGECNIEMPYQVPESRIFVMGDNRATSVDSRNTAVGCVAEEQIVGKLVFRVWPLKLFGPIE